MNDQGSARGRLADALETGQPLDLLAEPSADGQVLDDAVMRRWGSDHDLAADDLFDLVRGRGLGAETVAHPRGIQVRGARIIGRLVLDFVTDALPLQLDDCLLDDGISAQAAHLPYLQLNRCRITCSTGWVPLDAQGVHIQHDLRIDGSIITASPGTRRALELTGAAIGHRLSCAGAVLFSEAGPALSAQDCEVGGGVVLTGGFRASGSGPAGALRLLGARITGSLDARGAELDNKTGPALYADRCQVAGGVVLSGRFRASGAGKDGAVRLLGARITESLDARGAELVNESGPALIADRCQVGGNVSLAGGFRASGAGEDGAVGLHRARITGSLDISGAELSDPSGPALSAEGCEVGGDMLLTEGFRASGAGQLGAVRLLGARITGQLAGRDAKLISSSTTALDLEEARVGGVLFLDGGFTADGAGTTTTINLIGSRVGALRVNDRVTHSDDQQRRWNVDGCIYTRLPHPDDRQWWLELLERATPTYTAQPYQQLAAVHRAGGHDRDVRAILIAQRRDQIRRGDLTPPQKAWARLTGLVLGYGWKPWRALYGLAAVFTTSVVLAVVLGGHGALTHPPRPGALAEPCTFVEQVGVGLDLGTPLLGTAMKFRDRCPINPDPTSASATALTVSTWALQLLAWGLAALFVAGFTGAVRKT